MQAQLFGPNYAPPYPGEHLIPLASAAEGKRMLEGETEGTTLIVWADGEGAGMELVHAEYMLVVGPRGGVSRRMI